MEREIGIVQKKKAHNHHSEFAVDWDWLRQRTGSRAHPLWGPQSGYMGRRLSMLSMFESVELRLGPLSLTRSVMRMLGRLVEACVVGGGEVPSLRAGGGWRGLDGGVG